MTPTCSVTRAGLAEAALMAGIHARCFEKPWDEAAMAQFATAPGVLCLTGDVGTSPAGVLIARVAADEAELLTIGVIPDCRRAGLGGALLGRAMAVLAACGARQLYLEVDEENTAALGLYKALGATPVGRRERYYGDGADAAIFSLALSEAPSDDGPTDR